MRLRKISEEECCPYCGERCISFGDIVQAASIWSTQTCPRCGAGIKLKKGAERIKNAVSLGALLTFVVLTLETRASVRYGYWSMVPLISLFAVRFVMALFAGLRYEESMKYPAKPADSFLRTMQAAVRLCQVEIEKRNQGIPGEGTAEELENVVLPELLSLLENVQVRRLPPRDQRRLDSLVCARTVWGWNLEEPSAVLTALEAAEQAYRNL